MRILLFLLVFFIAATPAMAETKRIVALGDSLTAGYGLPEGDGFVPQLQKSLVAKGYDVRVENAGVSGDTASMGRARLADAIAGAPKPSLVIVALGANDVLRRMGADQAKDNIGAIIKELQAKNIPVLLVGIRGMFSQGPFFQTSFDKMYKQLAKEYDVPLHADFLEDIAMVSKLNQADGLHPNQMGVELMVKNILPKIEDFMKD